MKVLAEVIVELAAFLELSGDDVVDPDTAVSIMEVMGVRLQNASNQEKIALTNAAHLATAAARSRGAPCDEVEFYNQFLQNFNL